MGWWGKADQFVCGTGSRPGDRWEKAYEATYNDRVNVNPPTYLDDGRRLHEQRGVHLQQHQELLRVLLRRGEARAVHRQCARRGRRGGTTGRGGGGGGSEGLLLLLLLGALEVALLGRA